MYDELFEAWRRERENPGLQSLPKDFYTRLADYMRRIREERRMMDEESLRGKLLKMEEENVRKMIGDLVHARRGKIICLIEGGEAIPSSALTGEEESLCSSLLSNREVFEALLKDVMQGQKPQVKGVGAKGFLVIRILRELPQIVGADMKIYGPFKPEDIATLPEENARALIKQGAAVELSV
jgi:DNA replication factor GINS